MTINSLKSLLSHQSISLRPATLSDKKKIFNWLASSNLTSEMFGPPNFPNTPIPEWEDFDNDYQDYYFDGSQPMKGQCFVILNMDQEIGQINYNEINTNTKSTEIDIWLADRIFTGKSYGTEAIMLLCNYLQKQFGCNTIFIAPSGRNLKAIKAYKKAGFKVSSTVPDDFVADYDDVIIMERSLDHNL